MKRLRLLVLSVFFATMLTPTSAGALDFIQASGSPYSTGELESNSVLTGDLNGDGRDDVVTVNADYSYSVFLAGPTGVMNQVSGSPFSTGSDYAMSGALVEFTGDGNLDLAIASNNKVLIRPGQGNGTFGAPMPAITTTANGADIAAGLVNDDAFPDLAVAGWSNNSVFVIFGTGTGAPLTTVSVTVGSGPTGVIIEDFNSDGLGDLATVNLNPTGHLPVGVISVRLNQAPGLFTSFGSIELFGSTQGRGITSGDFNGDGDADIAQVGRSSTEMQVFYGNGTGSFQGATSAPDTKSNWDNSVASADFNGDGFDDALVGMSSNLVNPLVNWAPIFMGSSGTTLVESPDGPWNTTSPSYPWTVATGDFNDDGHPDWVSGDQGGRISVFINNTPTQSPGISIDPGSHDFGDSRITIDADSPPQTFTVESTGSGPLDIEDVDLTGTNADEFEIESETCTAAPIAPDGECSVVVDFVPETVGPKTASLSLSTNVAGSPQTAALSGTGTPFGYPSWSPTSVDFGPALLGAGPSAPAVFTMTAMGVSPLLVDQIFIAPNQLNAEDFSIVSDNCMGETFEPGETCEVAVAFEPTALGDRSARLRYYADIYTGILFLEGEGIDPGFTFTPSNQDFGTRLTDQGPGDPQTFTLTSIGTTDLETGALSLNGAAADQFQIVSNACSEKTLAPGAACDVSVAFAPTTSGEKVAQLSVALEGGLEPATSQLTGSGQDPVPPPNPCEPVAIKKVAYFTPSIKKRSNTPGVRARITTAGPAVVRVSSKVIYHLNGKQGRISYKQRQFNVATDSVNYKVAIPKKLRKKLKPKKQVRFVITYSSKAANPQCKKFGEKKTRNLTTRVVWVIPNA